MVLTACSDTATSSTAVPDKSPRLLRDARPSDPPDATRDPQTAELPKG